MLHHIVLLDPANAEAADHLREACSILATLVDEVPGMMAFHHGPNRDFEGKSARYAYGFSATFTDREAHLAYERHPEHVRAGEILVANSCGGHDGIFVADLDT